MPGIFFSRINKNGKKEIFSKLVEEKKKVFYRMKAPKRSLFTKKYGVAFLWILLLALLAVPFFLIKNKKNEVPVVFELPLKHLDFLGRQTELDLLEERILRKKVHQASNLLAICGEAGIGKTELAIAFANDHLNDFSLICWVDGSDEETLTRSYIGLAEMLEVGGVHPCCLKSKVHQKLESDFDKPWIMIFDDITRIPVNLPRTGGTVLVTCRDKSICPAEDVLELSKDVQQAKQLLSKLTGEKESETMDSLIHTFDALPLLINIVGHYIANTPETTLEGYSEMISSLVHTNYSPLKSEESSGRYSRSLRDTYILILNFLEKAQPLCSEFLKQVAFMHSQNIPLEFLERWILEKNISDPAEVMALRGDILRQLQNCSLIRYCVKTHSFSIHPLLFQVLNFDFRQDVEVIEGLKVFSKLDCVARYNPTRKNTIRPFQNILPHCLAILKHVQEADELSVKLALIVARYFLDTTHQLEKAKEYLLLAKKWTEGWDHPLRGRTLFLCGLWKYREAERNNNRQKGYLEALEYFNTALASYPDQDETYKDIEENPMKCSKEYQRAICMQFQGQMLRSLGQFETAEKRLNQALEAFYQVTEGKEHFDIARILREQGVILGELGDYDCGIQKVKEALAMQKRVYGTRAFSQPSLAATYRILGDLYFKKRELLLSDQAYEKAIQISQAAYQTEVHPYLALLYEKRAEVLKLQDKVLRSQEMEVKAQQIYHQLDAL